MCDPTKPAYPLDEVKEAILRGRYHRTEHADDGFGTTGMTEREVCRCIRRLQPFHFDTCEVSRNTRHPGECVDLYRYPLSGKKKRDLWLIVVLRADGFVTLVSLHKTKPAKRDR